MAKEEADSYINQRRDAEIFEDEDFNKKLKESISSEVQIVIFDKMEKIYQTLSKMRIDYAERMVTKEELTNLRKDLNALSREVSKLEGHMEK